jgi:hypothetical protein
LQIAESVFDRTIRFAERENEWLQRAQELELQIKELQNNIDETKIEQAIANLQVQQTLLDLTGETNERLKDLDLSLVEKQRIDLDCSNENNNFQKERAQIIAEKKRLIADLNAARVDQSTLEHDIFEQQQQILQFEKSRDNLIIDKNILMSRQKSVLSDQESLDRLIAAQDGKIGKLTGLQKSTEGLANESKKLTKLFSDLRLQQSDLMQRLSKDEQAFLIDRTEWMDTNAKERTNAIQKTLEKSKLRQDMQEQVTKIFSDLYTNVQKEREAIEKVAGGFRNDPKRTDLFFANQQEFDSLLVGLPEMIERKRRKLLFANELINRLRQRIGILYKISDGPELKPSSPGKLLNAEGIGDYVTKLTSDLDSNTKPIVIESQEIPLGGAITQDLQETGRASFAIGPKPSDAGSNAAFYRIWDKSLDEKSNLRLIDIRLYLPEQQCSLTNGGTVLAQIRHLGSGTVWKGQTATFEYNRERQAPSVVLQTNDEDEKKELMKVFSRLNASVNTFDEMTHNFTLTFLGLPVQAQYEIEVPDILKSTCHDRLSNARLILTYTRLTRGTP